MKVAIIGAGNVGTALGEGLRAAGHDVIYGVRAKSSGPASARMASPRDAAAGSDVVVLATPWSAAEVVVRDLGDLGGRVLVDAINPIAAGFKPAVGHTTSGAEILQALALNARVVKGFNTVGFEVMRAPRFAHGAAAMFLAGDDAGATATAAALATDLGFEAVPLVGLAHARELEPLAMLWIGLSRSGPWGRDFALGVRRRVGPVTPVKTKASRARDIVVYGAGHLGGALARAWLHAGHRVRVAMRDASAEAVRALVGVGAVAVAPVGGGSGADVVALAVHAAAAADVATHAGPLEGKLVIDCTNAVVAEHGLATSAVEQLAARLPGAHVVKAFNQQGAEVLVAPVFDGLPAVGFVAGDDATARASAVALVEDVGLRPVDAGPLAAARLLEPLTLLWLATSRALATRELGFVLLERRP